MVGQHSAASTGPISITLTIQVACMAANVSHKFQALPPSFVAGDMQSYFCIIRSTLCYIKVP